MIPTVSICIAAYNVEAYISECLLSIFEFEKIISKEIIIVDDCSWDNTVKIIKSIIEEYSDQKIILIENQNNLWPAGSYNKAVQKSNAQYITFLDSDDFLIHSWLSKKIEIMDKNSELEVIYANGVFFERGIQGLQIQNHMNSLLHGTIGDIKKKLYTTIPMLSVSCSIIRKDFFDQIWGFDPSCQSNDWVLNIRIFQHLTSRNNFSYVLDPVFAYRMHDKNISKDQNRMINLLSEVVDIYIPKEYRNIQYGNIYFFTSLNYLTQYDYLKALRFFRKSLSFDFRIFRIPVFMVAILTPTAFIIKCFPKSFTFLKKMIQRLSDFYTKS